MSYWVSVWDTKNDIEEFSRNMTSNVGGMYQLALAPYVEGEDDYGIRILHTMPCPGATILLEHAIGIMESNEGECRTMEPSNGWGTYEGALDFLESILRACQSYPHCKIYVSW